MATIGSSTAANSASFYLSNKTNSVQEAMTLLASGSNLSEPQNDAAGVAVSASLNSLIQNLGAATQNSQDAISFAQTADGFLSSVQSELTSMSVVAQQATNGTLSPSDIADYNTQYTDLQNQLTQTLQSASFNGTSIFASGTISVAIDAQGTTNSISQVNITNLTDLGLGSVTSITTPTDAQSAITALQQALQTVTSQRAVVNTDISAFNFNITNNQVAQINTEAANSSISDVDVAAASASLATNQILQQASISMLAQSNASRQNILQLLK